MEPNTDHSDFTATSRVRERDVCRRWHRMLPEKRPAGVKIVYKIPGDRLLPLGSMITGGYRRTRNVSLVFVKQEAQQVFYGTY